MSHSLDLHFFDLTYFFFLEKGQSGPQKLTNGTIDGSVAPTRKNQKKKKSHGVEPVTFRSGTEDATTAPKNSVLGAACPKNYTNTFSCTLLVTNEMIVPSTHGAS